MPRHRDDAVTKRLLAEMSTTRAELRAVIEALVERGVKQSEIAGAAGWNSGYLSDFLKNDQKNPSSAKLDDLIQALHALVLRTPGLGPKATEDLRSVAERYGRSLAQLANPADGPLKSTAPNYVRRPDLDDALARAVAVPGSYALDGQPMSGVSSALALVEALLRERGFEVCRVSAKGGLFEWKQIEECQTGIMGVLAAAITGSSEPLAMEFFAVQERIRERLADAPDGFALLVDDMNALDPKSVISLKSFVRDWATRRASGEAAFANTTVWLATTSNVSSASIRSQLVAEYLITRWFRKPEVRALAEAFIPFATAAGVGNAAGRWASGVSDKAFDLFGGQPQLTHLYLWDRHSDGDGPVKGGETAGQKIVDGGGETAGQKIVDGGGETAGQKIVDGGGETAGQKILTAPPAGAYERHLSRVMRSVLDVLGPGTGRAEELLKGLGPAESILGRASLAEHQMLERLGVVNEEGEWSCAYYHAHLPRLLEQGVTGQAPKPIGPGANAR
jgi:transcriptional regulator with XRE-family HTH domain